MMTIRTGFGFHATNVIVSSPKSGFKQMVLVAAMIFLAACDQDAQQSADCALRCALRLHGRNSWTRP